MNKQETLKLLSLITTAYPVLELTEERIELWQTMMVDIPLPQALANVKEHIETSRFPPTIADVKRVEVVDPEIEARNYQIAHQQWVNSGGDPEEFEDESPRKRLS